MRVLITGHRGFIGQHLSDHLAAEGHQVFGHDRPDGDLTQPKVFANRLALTKPDAVVHLAAQVGRLFGEEDVTHTFTSNALMTGYVARACGEADIPVLYASTSEVYGDQGEKLCTEDGPLELPHNLYGLTKRWGEEVLQLYAPETLMIARLSMPYGPGAPPGRGRRAMDNFLWQAYHRMEITVHRGAERSWCHVEDTVRALRLILEDSDGGTFNVGRDDVPISMLELAKMACEMSLAPYDLIRLVEAPPRQTVVKRLDTSKIRELGWRPTIELEEGMRDVFDWVRLFDENGQMAA